MNIVRESALEFQANSVEMPNSQTLLGATLSATPAVDKPQPWELRLQKARKVISTTSPTHQMTTGLGSRIESDDDDADASTKVAPHLCQIMYTSAALLLCSFV